MNTTSEQVVTHAPGEPNGAGHETVPTLGEAMRNRAGKSVGPSRRAAKEARHMMDKINGKRRGRL